MVVVNNSSDEMSNSELKKLFRSLLWNMAHQREKVADDLKVLMTELYPDLSVDIHITIKNKILEAIGYR